MALNSSSKKVLLCIPVPEFAGVARHLVDIAANGLEGFSPIFVSEPGELPEHLKQLGAQVHETTFGTSSGFFKSFKALDTLIEREKPLIVHTHLAYADIVAVAVINLRKLRKLVRRDTHLPKLISTEHGIAVDDLVYHGTRWRARLMETVHRIRLWFTDGKIAVSQFNAEQMKRKWGARDVEVIPNGVDLDAVIEKVEAKRVPAQPGILRVVSMARLAPEKKIDLLIDAFALVLQENPHAQLEIAGKGLELEALKKQVAALGIESKVNFSGFNDPFEVMGRNDVLVQLSIAENNSYTLLEAKAAGLKVIATAMGGNPEQLEEDEMVPALTSSNRDLVVRAAAQKILATTAEELGRVGEFSWSTTKEMTERITDKYQRVLKK